MICTESVKLRLKLFINKEWAVRAERETGNDPHIVSPHTAFEAEEASPVRSRV